MIKHIVFFRLKEGENPEEKDIRLNELKTMIEALHDKIDVIVSIETGINISGRDVAYDLALVSEFRSAKDLAIYNSHPEHQKVVDFLKNIKKDVAVVDYEF